MHEFFKDLIDNCAETIKELHAIIIDVIKDYNELEETFIKNGITGYNIKHNN